MPTDEYTRSEYLRALLQSKRNVLAQGNNLVNPSINGLAQLDTSFNGVYPQPAPEETNLKKEQKSNGFDQFMNNVLGFVDEMAAKFGSGFVNGWEGILDFGATAIGAIGDWTGLYNSQTFTDWAKQDIGKEASEWMKTTFGLGAWYNRIAHNDWNADEWRDIAKSFLDWNKAAFFAKNDLGDLRSELTDKYYKGRDDLTTGFGQFLGGAAHSIGFMLPSIMTAGAASAAGAGEIGVQAASLATLGGGAAGQGSQEALNEGASAGKALGYGAAVGATEVVSEIVVGKALGLVGLGTGKIAGVVGKGTSKTTAKVGSKLFLKNLAKTMNEEGMEEVFSAVLEPVMKSIYKGKDALKDYKSTDYWFGTNGHFNESVIGQYASGAFVGGLAGGMHESAVYRKVGADGYVALQAFQNLAFADAKMAKSEVQNKVNGNKYQTQTSDRTTAMNDFIEAVDKLLANGTEAQKKAFAEALTNPRAIERWQKQDNKSISDYVNKQIKEKYKTHEGAITQSFLNDMQRRFGTDVDFEIEQGEVKTDDNGNQLTARIEGNTIYINENVLKTEGGAKLAHEYMAHHLLKSLPNEIKSKLFRDVQNTEWYDENEKALKKLYKDEYETDKRKYDEEVFAYAIERTFDGGNVAQQLENLRQVFGSKGFFSGLQRMLRGARKFESPELIKQYVKTLDTLTKSLIKAKVYNRDALANFIEEYNKIKKELTKAKETTTAPSYSKERYDESEDANYSKTLPDGREAISSPIVYQGNKFKIIDKLFATFPKFDGTIKRFVDAFSGSMTVALNVDSTAVETITANELDPSIFALQNELKRNNPSFINNYINARIKEYDLRTLEGFKRFVEHFNEEAKKMTIKDNQRYTDVDVKVEDHHDLDLLILQRFSGQWYTGTEEDGTYKFTEKDEFKYNKDAFTDKKLFMSKLRAAHERLQHIELTNKDAIEIILDAKDGDFIYVDPPYSNTSANYNSKWNEAQDEALRKALDVASQKGVRWALSNVFDYNGVSNDKWKNWAKKYYVSTIDNVQYQKGSANEVVIKNCNLKGEIVDNGTEQERWQYDSQSLLGKWKAAQTSLSNNRSRNTEWEAVYDSSKISRNTELKERLKKVFNGEISMFDNPSLLKDYFDFLRRPDVKWKAFRTTDDTLKPYFYTPEMQMLSQEMQDIGGYKVYFYEFIQGAYAQYDEVSRTIEVSLTSMAAPSGRNLISVLRHERMHHFQAYYNDIVFNEFMKPMFKYLYGEKFNETKLKSFYDYLFSGKSEIYNSFLSDYGDGSYYKKWAKERIKNNNVKAVYDIINERRVQYGLQAYSQQRFEQKMTDKEIVQMFYNWEMLNEVMADLYGQHDLNTYDLVLHNYKLSKYNEIVNNFTKAIEQKTNTKLMFSKSASSAKTTKATKKNLQIFKNIETTADIVSSTRAFVENVLGEGYKTFAPKNVESLIKRVSTALNEVKDIDKEAQRVTDVILDLDIERNTKDGGVEYVGKLRDLFKKTKTKKLTAIIKRLIKTTPNTEARSVATRSYEIALDKAINEAQSYGNRASRVRVLTRQIDRLRKKIGRFTEGISDNEIIKAGLNSLLAPFIELHGNEKGFSAKDFKDNLQRVLGEYTEEKVGENYESMVYSDEVRQALVDVYEALGEPKRTKLKSGAIRVTYGSLSAEVMQKAIEATRTITNFINELETEQTNEILPASFETIEAINRSSYSKHENILARIIRAYKRGFAPAYVVIEEILGGNSEAARVLTHDIQNGVNSKTLYTGAYHDEINKQLKDLGIKKTFDIKKFKFRDVELTADQAMGLYISLNVQANYDAIEQDGADFYDSKTDKIVNLAKSGEAAALKTEIENALPEEYKKLAKWILEKANSSLKSEYIDYQKTKYGNYARRKEIGVLNDNSYWMLKRSYHKITNIEKAVANADALFKHDIKRTDGQGNAVLITGALSSFDSYVDRLGSELYVKPNYRKALGILNAKMKGGKSVMDVLSNKVQSQDIAYLQNVMKDMLGVNRRQGNLLDKMVSAFSVAKLSLNIGSMMKQFASIWTSNLPFRKSAKGLIANIFGSQEVKAEFRALADEIGGLKYREASKGVLMANADGVGKITKKIAHYGMIGISKVDMFTISTGVYSLMIIGQDQFNLKIGTEANKEFVKDHWAEFELSQIGNTALSKNAISNSDNLTRYLFGFLQGANRAALGSQIHKYNLWQRNRKLSKENLNKELKDAKAALEEAETNYLLDEEDLEARKTFIDATAKVKDLENQLKDFRSYEIAGGKAIPANMAVGLLAQGVFIALINALMKRVKGKKDWDEFDIAEEGMALAMSIGVDWIPMVNFFSSIVQGYEVTVPAVEIFNAMANIFKNARNQNWKTMVRQILILCGDMTGVPVQTLYAYVYGALKAFDPAIAEEMRSVLYGSSLQSATKTMQVYSSKGDVGKTSSMINLIINNYKTGSSTEEINKEIANLYIEGYNALPKSFMTQYTNEEGNVVKLSNEQIKQFMAVYSQSTRDVSKLMQLTEYNSLTSEERAKAIKKIYDAYYSMARAKITGAKAEGKIAQILALTNGNVGLAKYIASLQKIAQIGETKQKTRKELVIQYINRLRGYTKAEKTLLMYLAGYSVGGSSQNLLASLLMRYGASRKEIIELIK